MPTRVALAILPSILGLLAAASPAGAEIYTWTDASGVVNVSNLAPPEGVAVTRVTPDPPPHVVPPAELAREAARDAELRALADREKDLELQALSDRVQQLERDVELARAQALAPVVYAPPPAPVPYVEPSAPPACDPTWGGCGPYWGLPFYPSSVVVVSAPPLRKYHRSRGGPRFGGGHPMPVTGVPRPLGRR
jgi:hypothetical protein